jgi:hypothetical protein
MGHTGGSFTSSDRTHRVIKSLTRIVVGFSRYWDSLGSVHSSSVIPFTSTWHVNTTHDSNYYKTRQWNFLLTAKRDVLHDFFLQWTFMSSYIESIIVVYYWNIIDCTPWFFFVICRLRLGFPPVHDNWLWMLSDVCRVHVLQ